MPDLLAAAQGVERAAQLEALLAVPARDRLLRFNATTGTHGFSTARGRFGGDQHPDRCKCQIGDGTPHKHYEDGRMSCARCLECTGYVPHDWPDPAPLPVLREDEERKR